jgi:outer membrane protein
MCGKLCPNRPKRWDTRRLSLAALIHVCGMPLQRPAGVTLIAVASIAAVLAARPPAAAAETIASALANAYKNNPELNAERSSVRQADEGVAQTLSGYRPTIKATAGFGAGHTDLTVSGLPSSGSESISLTGLFPTIIKNPAGVIPPINIRGPTTSASVGLDIEHSLYDAKLPNQTRAAESRVFAAREALRMMEQSVLLSAATVYMDYLRDTANLQVQRSSVRVFEKMLVDTRSHRAAGEISQTDVSQAEAQLASGEASLAAAQAALMGTRANYARVIGDEPASLSPATLVTSLCPPTLDASIAQATRENPALTAAMYGVDVAQLQVKIAEAGLLPTLRLQANVEDFNRQTTNTLDANTLAKSKLFDSSVIARLDVPIYQGGREYSLIRQTKEATGQRELDLEKIRNQVRANVIQLWGQADALKIQTAAAERQVKASENALDGVRLEARVGLRTTLDVLNAQQALVNARLNLIAAQRNRVVTSYDLLASVGRLSAATLRLPVEIYDPSVHYHQIRDSWIGILTPDGR